MGKKRLKGEAKEKKKATRSRNVRFTYNRHERKSTVSRFPTRFKKVEEKKVTKKRKQEIIRRGHR